MADDNKPGDGPVDLSAAIMQRMAREMSSPKLDSRLPDKPAPTSYELVSPMTQAFNRLGDRGSVIPQSVPFMGTSPISYTTVLGSDGISRMDGKRGIEYRVPDSDLRLLAGSYLPGNRAEGVENWTAAVAWTPLNLGGLKVGPIVGDVAQSDTRGGGNKPFDRVGMTVGLYATAETKEGGVFARIETDPAHNNKPRVFVGVKLPFNGQ